MANRYWVGGSGTWNTSSTANWSATSGGASGASAPTLSDNVFFDANSFTSASKTVTIAATVSVANISFEGAISGTQLSFNPNTVSIFFYGNFTGNPNVSILGSGNGNGSFYYRGTSSAVLDPRGQNLGAFRMDTAGGTLNLASDAVFNSGSNIGFYQTANNTFNTNGYTVTTFFLMSSSGTLNFSSSTINITATTSGTGQYGGFYVDTTTTVNASSATVIMNVPSNFYRGMTLDLRGKSLGTLKITGTTESTRPFTIVSNGTVANIEIASTAYIVGTSGTTLTVTGTYLDNGATLLSNTSGSTWGISKSSGVLDKNGGSLKDVAAAGGATWRAHNTTNVSGNSGWTFIAPRFWVGGAGWWGDTAHWSTTSGGAGGASVPTSTNDVYFDSASGSGTVTLTNSTSGGTYYQMLGFSTVGWTGTITNGPDYGDMSIYWNVALGANNTVSGLYPEIIPTANSTVYLSSLGSELGQAYITVQSNTTVVFKTDLKASWSWGGTGTIRLDANVECTPSYPSLTVNTSSSSVPLTINLNGYTLTTAQLTRDQSSPTGNVNINIANSTLEIIGEDVDTTNRQALNLTGITLQDSAKTGTVKFTNSTVFGSGAQTLKLGSSAINIGTMRIEQLNNGTRTNTLPNFTSYLFYVSSAGTGTKTINIATATTDRFIGIGPSTANKLNINGGMGSAIKFNNPYTATSYGRSLNLSGVAPTNNGSAGEFNKQYIGSDSTANTSWGSVTWKTVDPPKAATFVDTMSGPVEGSGLWKAYATVTQITSGQVGGGYYVDNSDDMGSNIVAADTYDLLDSPITFQVLQTNSANLGVTFGSTAGISLNSDLGGSKIYGYVLGTPLVQAPTNAETVWYKLALSGTTLTQSISTDGKAFATVRIDTVDPNLYRSERFQSVIPGYRSLRLGAVNVPIEVEASPWYSFDSTTGWGSGRNFTNPSSLNSAGTGVYLAPGTGQTVSMTGVFASTSSISIPSDKNISGIEVILSTDRPDGGSDYNQQLSLSFLGDVGTAKPLTYYGQQSGSATNKYGSYNDMWGTSLSKAQVMGGGGQFGVSVKATGTTSNDYYFGGLKVKVYYSAPVSDSNFFAFFYP